MSAGKPTPESIRRKARTRAYSVEMDDTDREDTVDSLTAKLVAKCIEIADLLADATGNPSGEGLPPALLAPAATLAVAVLAREGEDA